MTFGDRVTLRPGMRFDRMVGTSIDVPEFDLEFNEVGTLKGSGHLVTWNQVSPRVGAQHQVERKTARPSLRAVAGRYYLPLFLGEFEDLHPGSGDLADDGLQRGRLPWSDDHNRHAELLHDLFSSQTDSKHERQFRPEHEGAVHRSVRDRRRSRAREQPGHRRQLVHKRAGNVLGWVDTGATLAPQTVNVTGTTIYGEQVNQTLTVQPRTSPASASLFLRTNGPGFYSEYDALILSVTKRLANRWQFTAGYTRQRARGLEPGGTTGRDTERPTSTSKAISGPGIVRTWCR